MPNVTICTKCQQLIYVGCFPFCPHGKGKAYIVGDDIPGGMVMDHLEEGRRVYSKTELKAVLKAHRSERFPNGARLSEKGWTGNTDQHLKRWGWVPSMLSQEERRRQMAAWLGMSNEEYDQQFPA